VTTPRILVVEDDAPVASVLERGLLLAGYEVAVVEDGSSAAATWADGGYAAVILDVMLPGLDGIELCRRMRSAGDVTPVVMLTARDDDELRRAGLAAGASAYVTKPFVYADLLALVRAITSSGSGSGSQRPGSSR
jgi:DNA-binding response OmpR family regulator